MLNQTIHNFPAAMGPASGADVAIVDFLGSLTWQELEALTTQFETSYAALSGQRVGIEMQPQGSAISWLAALTTLGAHIFLFPSQTEQQSPSTDDLEELAQRLCLGAILRPQRSSAWHEWSVTSFGDHPAKHRDLVTILTSGTEGRPKAVTHTWESLARPVRKTKPGQRWLLTYRPELYAGLQVLLQALLNYGTLLMPSAAEQPQRVAEMMSRYGAEYGSATPSYWRRLLMFADRDILQQVPLRQITLGGEIADQEILSNLSAVFPTARIVHIYATTELGRCFSVTDGQAGFPVSFLADEDDNQSQPFSLEAQLKIEDGQLFVRSANRMMGYEGAAAPGEWFPTGDLVEIEGDRVMFAGRNGDMINVGGNKVHPIEVERLVRSIDGVRDVRVYGKDSSVAGQLVACDVVPTRGCDREELVQRINKACRERLRTYQNPRVINLVDEITTTGAGKVKRREL